jgi:hypothetical protein
MRSAILLRIRRSGQGCVSPPVSRTSPRRPSLLYNRAPAGGDPAGGSAGPPEPIPQKARRDTFKRFDLKSVMSDIFLSYADEDKERIANIVATLEQQGWGVWWDHKIRAGTKFTRSIEQALEAARCVVVVWSQQSVESNWVHDEAYEGLQRSILVPVLIDDVKLPFGFRMIEAARLIGWEGEPAHPELEVLLESIEAVIGPRRPPAEAAPATPPAATKKAAGGAKARKAAKRKHAAVAAPKAELRAGAKSHRVRSRGLQGPSEKGDAKSPSDPTAKSSPAPRRASAKSGVRATAAAEAEGAPLSAANASPPSKGKPAKPAPDPAAAEAAAKARRAEAIRNLLVAYLPQRDLFVTPDIPESKLKNAWASCEVPPGERVVGLIDCTTFGSAKHCLLFGTEGIYFRNPWSGGYPTMVPGFVPYGEFANREFGTAFFLNVDLGGGLSLDCSGCGVPREVIVEILKRVQGAVG